MQLGFGSGALWGERIDVTGSGIGPVQFGILQDVTIDFDYTLKELRGQYQFPVAIARADGKITGKARFARILGALYSDILFGSTPATGQLAVVEYEAGTIPATSTYTVTTANAANYADDLGVYFAATGKPFKRVTSPSATGEYSVNLTTGVYTFGSADASAAVLISYAWNNASTGKKITINNLLTGTTPQWKATFNQPISPGAPGAGGQSLPHSLRLNACTSNKFSMPTKIDDWEIQEFDFSAFADPAGVVGYFSTSE